MVKKILFSSMIIFSCLNAIASNNINSDTIAAKSWRDGFITAYKAMQVETKLQGLDNRIIPVEKYIIYFDASKDDVSTWDTLMVQMFGYSSSIYKPIRTTNNLLIFGLID